jgi:hypothetical protein
MDTNTKSMVDAHTVITAQEKSELVQSPTQTKMTCRKVAQSLVDYFSLPQYAEVTDMLQRRDGTTEEIIRREERPLPMIEEWCIMNRITINLLNELAKNSEEVREAIQFAKDVMKVYLVRGGLEKRYDSRFAVFVATNETDMQNKTELTVNNTSSPKKILSEIEAEEESLI